MASKSLPNLELERAAQKEFNCNLIAGLDEAGRGAIAGPVVAAAVILPLDHPKIAAQLAGVNDSKQLQALLREELEGTIKTHALAWGVGLGTADEIDRLGILPANARAMTRAIASLARAPDFLLLDGRVRLRNLAMPQKSIIRGDGLSLSIAAASILAKVARDRLMIAYEADYPGYGFARHKGYGTRMHLASLERLGPCTIHRRSFAPLRQRLL